MDQIEVRYYNSDDGIWLLCKECKWEHHMEEFAPTVDQIVEEAEKHTC